MIDGRVEAVLAEVHRKIEAALSAAPGDHFCHDQAQDRRRRGGADRGAIVVGLTRLFGQIKL